MDVYTTLMKYPGACHSQPILKYICENDRCDFRNFLNGMKSISSDVFCCAIQKG
ncbi:hypothetical protein CSE45_3959 [Citreicella sp. SE45]|nr:hypothetical protein CSE45_3959 [Citreicella sp. SE45]